MRSGVPRARARSSDSQMEPAGGIRTATDPVQYLVVQRETLGPRWMTLERLRSVASSLLDDVQMQLPRARTGANAEPDDFTLE